MSHPRLEWLPANF